MEGMMQTGDRPAFEQPQWTLDDVMEETARAVQVVHAAGGDTRKLSPAHRANVLAGLCKALGLNPLTNPIIYVVLNGKEVVYVTRQATDQIAARALRREEVQALALPPEAQMRELIRRILQRGVDRGEFRIDDMEYAALAVVAPMIYLQMNQHSEVACAPAGLPIDPARYLRMQADILLGGLCARADLE